MSKIALSSPASGTATFTIAAPVGSTDRTLTLPDNSGTLLTTATPGVPVDGPAFSAYQSVGTVCANVTATKQAINTEEYDTASCFDNVTNYRFTPTVAGYYQVNAYISCGNTNSSYISIYKNGADFKRGSQTETGVAAVGYVVSTTVSMNGSTDYLELYFFNGSGGSRTSNAGANLSYFQAALVRTA